MINVEVSSQEFHCNMECHVFINHCGKDVKKTVASLVYHNLSNKRLRVFLDCKSLQQGQPFPLTIHQAIASASIHIAIFSNKYAESAWCLRELCLMEESGAPIIPIFCGVRPRDLRQNGGVYSKSLRKHRLTRRVDGETVEKWRATLRRISYNYGFQFQGDQGIVLEEIAECIMQHIEAKRRLQFSRVVSCIFCNALWILIGLLLLIFIIK
ncbi:hypothetical protein SUGI_0082270 [Cryptomeria japonica]|nr:hypothetical protein SUGI_0082270 [Cryptomeria japonica]